ncbi:hypothetical protein RM69_08180, partial [Mesotoga sp. SC_NapDC3]
QNFPALNEVCRKAPETTLGKKHKFVQNPVSVTVYFSGKRGITRFLNGIEEDSRCSKVLVSE